MGWARKLGEWQAAGLIDVRAVDAIVAYEGEHSRPVALRTVTGFGLLALALGILLLVAANWDAIPAGLKLGVHFVLMTGTAAACWWGGQVDRRWLAEGALFLLAAFTLAGIALQSQVYQLTGPLWQALAWWALLAAPALLIVGRTALTASALSAMLLALAFTYQLEPGVDRFEVLGQALSAAIPPALVLGALLLPPSPNRAPFRIALLDAGLFLTLAAASLLHLTWASQVSTTMAADAWPRLLLAVGLAAVAAWLARYGQSPRDAIVIAVIMLGAAATTLLGVAVPHPAGPGSRLVGLVSFAALWGSIAWAAQRSGSRRLFSTAVAVLAVRLFLIYVELFYSLAFTGAGLVISGALLIALASGWSRIVGRGQT